METKNIIFSKTLWFNVLSIIGVVLTDVLASPEFRAEYGGEVIWIMIAGALANVLLRFGTKEPIVIRPQPKPLNPVDQALADEAEEHGMV